MGQSRHEEVLQSTVAKGRIAKRCVGRRQSFGDGNDVAVKAHGHRQTTPRHPRTDHRWSLGGRLLPTCFCLGLLRMLETECARSHAPQLRTPSHVRRRWRLARACLASEHMISISRWTAHRCLFVETQSKGASMDRSFLFDFVLNRTSLLSNRKRWKG